MESDHELDGESHNDKKTNNESDVQKEEPRELSDVLGDVTMDQTLGESNNCASGTSTVESCTHPLKGTKSERKLIRKLCVLQEKTKSLRERFTFGLGARRSVKQQEDLVQESEVALRRNDDQAAFCMSKLSAMTSTFLSSTESKPSTSSASTVHNHRNTETSSSCSTILPKNCKNIQLEQQQIQKTPWGKVDKAKEKKKTRYQLEDQLQKMRELVLLLTAQNPLLENKVRQIVFNNKRFKNLDLFSHVSDSVDLSFPQDRNGRNTPLKNQTPGKGQSCILNLHKQRRNSIKSNSNSVTSLQGTVHPSTSKKSETTILDSENNKPKSKNDRKKRAKKKNKVIKSKSQKTEQEALEKYLKAIVQNFLKDTKRVMEYTYKPDEEDLETYAQRLTQAGFGHIVEEPIRVNRKNNRQSFIMLSSDRESTEHDGIITVPVARQYAFEGDVVRAFVTNTTAPENNTKVEDKSKKEDTGRASIEGGNEQSCSGKNNACGDETESPDFDIDLNEVDITLVSSSKVCPKAFVIKILKKTGKREVVGTISFKNSTKLNDEQYYYRLKPHDMRIPMIYIPVASCHDQITSEEKNDVCGFIYVVHVRETDAHGHCIAELHQPVGKVGNLEAETRAILSHNDLKDVGPYEERFNEMFAQPNPPITDLDLSQREDLRKKCIFTIDPLTAKDLDDAVSIDLISSGVYEVGVHISDVTLYLQEDSELDNIVKFRATSIYLVNEVIHMLPKTLCFKCSLLPGEDKFAFSVFWRIKLNGDIIGEPRFTRSIINSCTQFAYEHAQKIIDNPQEDFDVDDFPTICNDFTTTDITSRVLVLNTIAKCLRAKRYDGGALSINNTKLRFTIDPVTGEPVSYEVDARLCANFLIEEYMLLANQSVARFIYDCFPKIAVLRNHGPPLSKSMKSLKQKLAKLGIDFDYSSSKTIYESMQRICANAENPTAMDIGLNTLLTKPMARAKYFCSESKTEESDLWHYALSIPIYTHFTSPIRRYPDILVHRLLAAALDYCPPPKRTVDELHEMTNICNIQKWNAKNAGDESTNLFFRRYVKSKLFITLSAVVIEIFQHFMNVVTIETGHAISIEYKLQKVHVDTSNLPAYILVSEKNSKNPPLKLHMFSTLDIKVMIWDDKINGVFVSPDPKQRQINSIQSSKKTQHNGVLSNNLSNSQHSSNSSSDKPEDDSNQADRSKENPAIGLRTVLENKISNSIENCEPIT